MVKINKIHNQKGFTVTDFLMVVIVITIVLAAGFYLHRDKNAFENTHQEALEHTES